MEALAHGEHASYRVRIPRLLEIMQTPAHTVAGPRIKAMVAVHANADLLWDKPARDLDWNDKGHVH